MSALACAGSAARRGPALISVALMKICLRQHGILRFSMRPLTEPSSYPPGRPTDRYMWHDPLREEPDGLVVRSIERFYDEVLDADIGERLEISHGIFRRERDHKIAPGTRVALLQALRKVMVEFGLDARRIRPQNEPAGRNRTEHGLKRASERVAVA